MASNDGGVRVCPNCDAVIVEDFQLSPNVNICPRCGYDMSDSIGEDLEFFSETG